MSPENILLRRYLCRRLASYYSQPAHKVVGSIDSGFISRIPAGIKSCDAATISSHENAVKLPMLDRGKAIDFRSLWGEWHWRQTYKRVYKEQQGMWLTPCELFKPYYSNILANFVSVSVTKTSYSEEMFEIVEFGGGRGTNAKAILDHLSKCHPSVYKRLRRYTIFDTSPTLHELQKEVILMDKDQPSHAEKVELVNLDLMHVAEGNANFLCKSETPTVAIALELLDNLPHDKIGRCIDTNEILQAELVPLKVSQLSDAGGNENTGTTEQTFEIDITRQYTEIFAPLNDPLLKEILSVAPKIYTPTTSQGPRWIPTVALGVLMKLFECRPNSTVAFADFDWLPQPDLGMSSDNQHYLNSSETSLHPIVEPAIGDPLVTDMNGVDHFSYLTEPSDALCDILFPTDFGRLAAFVKQYRTTNNIEASGSLRKASVTSSLALKQSDFLLKYGSNEVDNTKSWLTGFSPLVDDFGNCSVLTVAPRLQE